MIFDRKRLIILDRILEAFKDDTTIDLELDILNLVYDGIYYYEAKSLGEKTRYSLYSRFSYCTKDNKDFGYLLFQYDIEEEMQETYSEFLNKYNFNKILISDFGLGIVVRSELYKDKTGFYYLGRTIMKMLTVKIRLPEYFCLFMDIVNSGLDYDNTGLIFPTKENMSGWNCNTNQMSLIKNIISINYKEDEKDKIVIHGICHNRKTIIENNRKVNEYYIHCTIPPTMYSSIDHRYFLSKGLEFIITLKFPISRTREIKKNIKKYLVNDNPNRFKENILNKNDGRRKNCFNMSTPLVYSYYKPNNTSVSKVVAIMIHGKNYGKMNDSYVKFNLLSNFTSFTSYFTEILGVSDIMDEE
jgi:hypothetical protein